jgi:ferredoxin-NADP reductase
MTPPSFDVRVVRTRELSPSVRELVFAREDGAVFAFEPGQWVSLVLPVASGEVRRAYSIASSPSSDSSFAVAVTRVENGAGSNLLHELLPGSIVRAVGPQGFFTRDEASAQPALFIGTGTGIAPLRSMVGGAVGRSSAPLWLLFGGREEHDLLYREELAELAARHPSFRVEETLSRGSLSWAGRRGYVQAHARSLYEALAATTSTPPHVYVCGLERMVGAIRALFRQEMGLPRQLVHSERYD